MNCKKCNFDMVFVGFEHTLITRGKNKGKTRVRDFYRCVNEKCINKLKKEKLL